MNPSAATILIVEDERTVVRGLEYGLRNEGFTAFWAATGRQALALVQQHDPQRTALKSCSIWVKCSLPASA